MKLHFITVPIHGSEAAEEDLNRFLSSHRVLAVDRQLVADGPRSAWAICVSYTDLLGPSAPDTPGKKGRLDYREILPPEDFQIFARLCDLRKQLAERDAVRAHESVGWPAPDQTPIASRSSGPGKPPMGSGVEVADADAPSKPPRKPAYPSWEIRGCAWEVR